MRIFNKKSDKDFIILNLTDTQLSNEEWAYGHKHRKILEHTVTELVTRSKWQRRKRGSARVRRRNAHNLTSHSAHF